MQVLETKKIPQQTVITLEHVGPHSEIPKAYRELHAWAKKRGILPAGPTFTIFLDPPNEFDPHSGRFEVCMPVAKPPQPEGPIRVRTFPAGPVAFSQVKGPYSEIPAHYVEMLAWIDAQGWEVAGAPREVYIVHPAHAKKITPKDYITEIQFPVTV